MQVAHLSSVRWSGPKMDTLFDGAGFIFGFRVLPAIIFVTALVSILYYIGVMGILIRILGGIFQKALNISKIESFVAVTTIFLGQNEIPAIVKPFIDRLNRNELFTAICSGMASIAGSTMIGYAALGRACGISAGGIINGDPRRDLVCPPVKPGYGIFAGFL
ncbi:putative nucleoside transporter [Escherichia coli]|nr:putative nucleoside transporter [Escherichia coli]